jgi:hypothetical protein
MMAGIFDNIIQTEQDTPDTNSKHLEMIFQQIYDKSNIEVKTDLNQQQINAITKALIFADKYNVGILKDIAIKHMELLISKDRQSRKEFTTISAKMNDGLMHEPTLFDKLVGK